MSEQSSSNSCPECGAVLTLAAAQGLCPHCLMAGVMQPSEPTVSRGGTPTLEQVSGAFSQLEVVELIGRGGMGAVFKVRQPKLDRFAALKLLPLSLAADGAFAGRFEREARLLAKLSHPNIVAVYDYGQAGDFFFLLMEFVDGVNLRQAMRASRFEPRQALGIVPKICEALQYAHDEGVLHRDIKPENILLDTKGRVKLVDFGIAKLTIETDAVLSGGGAMKDTSLTQAGIALGTPSYMAPEQREHPSDVDHRADIYSLGVVFYELLTGELPAGGLARPSEKSGADPRVDAIVQQALENERDRRQSSAGEVRTQVETIAASAKPPAALDIAATVEWAVKTISECAEGDPRIEQGMASLRSLNQVEVVNLLVPHLKSSTDTIRRSAIFILWKGGFADIQPAVPALLQLLKHPENFTRGMAALALGYNQIAASWAQLTAMANDDKDGYARRCAVAGLASFGPTAVKKEVNEYPTLASVAMSFAGMSGILGVVAWFRMPEPPQIVVWGILVAAVVGILLAIPVRRTKLGKKALIYGGINVGIWLAVAAFAPLTMLSQPHHPATTAKSLDSPVPATQGSAVVLPLSFGPVIERIIEPANPDRRALNLVSGSFIASTPGHILDFSEDGINTLRDAGIDLYYQDRSQGFIGLNMLDMRLCVATSPGDAAIPNSTVDTITAEELRQLLDRMKVWRSTMESAQTPGINLRWSSITIRGTNAYLFTTRDGVDGVLQIVDSPEGSRRIKIRYKLVQEKPAIPIAPENEREILSMQLDAAKNEVVHKQKLVELGVATVLELQAAKDKVDLLDAELNGTPLDIARTRLRTARIRVKYSEQIRNAGLMSQTEFDQAKSELAIAEVKMREAQAKAPTSEPAGR